MTKAQTQAERPQSSEVDYSQIKLKVGLEVHQQLATSAKLFCSCPPFSAVESDPDAPRSKEAGEKAPSHEFTRLLRPSASELGEFDLAAKFESRRTIRVRYLVNSSSSCLVEADEEPPHPINEDALDTSLIFSLALGAHVVDEVHVMRKIVVDGSNTSGFQRTAVVALGGLLRYGENREVKVQSISVEEDAGRAITLPTQSEDEKAYALDRLGTPLVETALAPIEGVPPDQIELAASSLGRLFRSTGLVARGLGTIRQDLNISILDGAVIEVKGVQKLDLISKVVRYEAARQAFLVSLSQEISRRTKGIVSVSFKDVTDAFQNTSSKIMLNILSKWGPRSKVLCLAVGGFKGLLGRENNFQYRLGKELGAIARAYGLGGVFHSDELPNYGITEVETNLVREIGSVGAPDAFVLIAGDSTTVEKASSALAERLKLTADGVPPETRAATEDGETTFLRPRPGAARMYPETDIPLIHVSRGRLERLQSLVPKPWGELIEEFRSRYGLPIQLAEPLYDSEKRREVFERAVSETRLTSRFIASILLDSLQALSRQGVPVDHLSAESFSEIFAALDRGLFAKEALPTIFRLVASEPTLSVDQAIGKAGLGSLSDSELESVADGVISENREIILARGMDAQRTIMGKVMQQVRGRSDGKTVSEVVSRKLTKYLAREEVNSSKN